MSFFSTNLANTLGLEVEGVSLNKSLVAELLPKESDDSNKSFIKAITRDASVESVARVVNSNVSLFLGNNFVRSYMRPTSDFIIGYEIVTNPLNRDQMRMAVAKISSCLNKSGEIYSPRASIHVHTGFPNGLIFIKNAILTGLKTESLLFKLAGMGREYRGAINKSAYARPLCMPPAIRTEQDSRYLVLSPEEALNAESLTELWAKFAIRPSENGRYIPLRYFATNIYSVLLRGTMEYRYFNYTSVTSHINAVVELCQLLSDIMIRVPMKAIRQLPDISIFDTNSNSDYVFMLNEIIRLGKEYCSDYGLTSESHEALLEIIATTPQPVFKKEIVRTHLNDYVLRARDWPLELVTKVEDPGIVNVHNFSHANRSMLL